MPSITSNSPHQTVIAGTPGQVDTLVAQVVAENLLARRIEVDVASHHRIIDAILPELQAALAGLSPATPAIPIITITTIPITTQPISCSSRPMCRTKPSPCRSTNNTSSAPISDRQAKLNPCRRLLASAGKLAGSST